MMNSKFEISFFRKKKSIQHCVANRFEKRIEFFFLSNKKRNNWEILNSVLKLQIMSKKKKNFFNFKI